MSLNDAMEKIVPRGYLLHAWPHWSHHDHRSTYIVSALSQAYAAGVSQPQFCPIAVFGHGNKGRFRSTLLITLGKAETGAGECLCVPKLQAHDEISWAGQRNRIYKTMYISPQELSISINQAFNQPDSHFFSFFLSFFYLIFFHRLLITITCAGRLLYSQKPSTSPRSNRPCKRIRYSR